MSNTFPSVQFDYRGARVLVTGGSNGIGEGIARAYLAAGAEVTITGTRARAEDYGKDLGAFTYLPMTATDNGSLERLAKSIPALDILINNAGGVLANRKDEWQPEVFEEAVAWRFGERALPERLGKLARGEVERDLTLEGE